MSVEEALEEVTSSINKKPVIAAGPPWTLVATYNNFAEASNHRAKIKEGFAKIRRRTNGTFTVHTRDVPPGGSKASKKK